MATQFQTCPFSGEKFQPRRSNQKFKDSKSRNDYYNEQAKKIRQAKAGVDRPLAKNYRALTQLLGNDKEQVFHREFLLGRGIDFRFFTSHQEDNGKSNPIYYNFSLSVVEDNPDFIKIKKL